MMIAVAVIAALLYAESMRRQRATEQRREGYRTRAAMCRMYGRHFREAFEKRSAVVFAIHHGPEFAKTPALRLKWAQYYEGLASKYEHAASRPWEPIPPDLPPPEIVTPDGDY
jgi:hypothetical protein